MGTGGECGRERVCVEEVGKLLGKCFIDKAESSLWTESVNRHGCPCFVEEVADGVQSACCFQRLDVSGCRRGNAMRKGCGKNLCSGGLLGAFLLVFSALDVPSRVSGTLLMDYWV